MTTALRGIDGRRNINQSQRARNWLRDLPHDQQAAITDRQNFFCYVQWIAHHQWREIKSYAEDAGRGADGRYSIWRELS